MRRIEMISKVEEGVDMRSKQVGNSPGGSSMRGLLIAPILLLTVFSIAGCYQTGGRVLRDTHPSMIGAHGTGQMIERHVPTMINHWRNTRRAIDNVDNITVPRVKRHPQHYQSRQIKQNRQIKHNRQIKRNRQTNRSCRGNCS